MPIDTLKAAKRLQQEDTFSPEQAERIAEVLSELDVASATKEDLDEAESRLGERIDEVEARLGERIDHVEAQMNERFERVDERFERAEEARSAIEDRLTQRIELSEQRMEKQISQLRSDLYRVLLVGFGAVAALVSVLNYVLG